jgi:hypothetical protein
MTPARGEMLTTADQTPKLDALLAEAARKLSRIADESGAGSPLHRLCNDLWCRRLEDARPSLEHGDHANALVILGHALELLATAPTILARSEMSFDDLELLLWAA